LKITPKLTPNSPQKNFEKAFLEDTSHRIRFVYTPKHCSWLNQIEIWFSGLSRRVLRRGDFGSVEALKTRILDYTTNGHKLHFFDCTFSSHKGTKAQRNNFFAPLCLCERKGIFKPF